MGKGKAAMIAQGEGEEMIPELPPGSLFAPTDDQLLNFYLARKIAGETVPSYIIATSNVFETEPWKLPIDGFMYGNGNEAYYFARRTQKHNRGSRVNRQAGGGTWKATGSNKPVKNHHGVVVGYKLHLTYYYPHGSNEASNWILDEYRFAASKDNSNPKPKFEEWVVCRIKHKTEKKETHHQGGGEGGAHNLELEVDQSARLLCPPVLEMHVLAESMHHPNPSDDDQVVQVEGREHQMTMDDGFQTEADMQLQLPGLDECIGDEDYWGCTLEELLQSPTPATADDHQGSSSLELDKEDEPQAKRPRLNAPPVPDSTLHTSPITCLTPPPPMDMEGNDMGIRPFETDHTAGLLPQSPHLSTANETWSIDIATVTDHTAADAGLLVQSPRSKVPFSGFQAIDRPISLLGF